MYNVELGYKCTKKKFNTAQMKILMVHFSRLLLSIQLFASQVIGIFLLCTSRFRLFKALCLFVPDGGSYMCELIDLL